MRVIEEPKLQFRCKSCGALNEGKESEFVRQSTMPPTWQADCGFCKLTQLVAPPALLAKAAGQFF